MKDVGRYLADCRKSAGLTQKEVADKLGMTDRVVSDWERGVTLPAFDVMARLITLIGGDIQEATRLLLSERNEAQAVAAQMGVEVSILTALAGLPVDPSSDPDGRYAELAKQISISPWIVERLPDILGLTRDELHEVMLYLEFRRARQSGHQSNP